jgi:hypothetical protein
MQVIKGNTVILSAQFKNYLGEVVVPDVIELWLLHDGSDAVKYVLGEEGSPIQFDDDALIFEAVIEVDVSGYWYYAWHSADGYPCVAEGEFYVKEWVVAEPPVPEDD